MKRPLTTLIMGSPEAEKIRELDHKVLFWLLEKHPCPECYDDILPEDIPTTLPNRCCPLCNGKGEVTGEEIEDWALAHERERFLPDW